jgi:lipopolysaccharide biosynthesis regulator YciM
MIGQTVRAIEHYEQALDILHDIDGQILEGRIRGNLGRCHLHLGQVSQAIEYFEQALSNSRMVDDLPAEGTGLGYLGNCYAALGQTARAIKYCEQALAIAREIGDRAEEGNHLSELGNRYAELGQTARAIEFHEQALSIDREIGSQHGEGADLGNLAEALIDGERYAEAIQNALERVRIGEEIGSPNLGNYNNGLLALAHFFAADLSAARSAAEAARQYDVPRNNHYAMALLGLVALRQGDRAAAHAAFSAAIAQADALLAHTPQLFRASDSKGLALCGLALLEKDLTGFENLSGLAADAYRAARAANADAGGVARVLRLFDALCAAEALVESDPEGRLAGVRAAAAGEDPDPS